ncbi:competence protein ComX [Streptococcus agalactiae LMG 14747]|uniref:Competence protein ComX n=2 Tax=Streptococcus TaxID=1301 RepID=V6Z1I0_STRAG|nr:competence protein ComX [Streptococcus agalactiae LMG 14747]ESV54732.1 competence protein ComX [Streptococcus agalactiae LMG 14747]MDY3023809.1 sigma-70 family RNA polymerase sigma factor [Streptococcus hyovaginalis]
MENYPLNQLSFESLYQCVKPIVFKLRRQYHIQLWESSDWEQEAMICLFRLIDDKPDCLREARLFFACFKTKFSNYLKDVLRSQESHKRRLNRLPYEEVSTLSHAIAQKGLALDEKVVLFDQLDRLRATLPESEQYKVGLLVSGKPFKGRQALLRQFRQLWLEDGV